MNKWTSSDPRTYHFLRHELEDRNCERVINLLEEIYKEENGGCDCVECVADVAALTLSSLTPDYRWLSPSRYSSKVPEETLREEIHRALKVVRARPRHDVPSQRATEATDFGQTCDLGSNQLFRR